MVSSVLTYKVYYQDEESFLEQIASLGVTYEINYPLGREGRYIGCYALISVCIVDRAECSLCKMAMNKYEEVDILKILQDGRCFMTIYNHTPLIVTNGNE